SGHLFAQTIGLKEIQMNFDGKISVCKPTSVLNANPANEQIFLKKVVQPNNQLQLKLVRTVKDENSIHNFYQFVLHDIPLEGADYVVHSINDHIDFANGNIPILTGNTQSVKA